MATKKKAAKKAAPKKEVPLKANMGFEEAMKKALNTPLPIPKKKAK